MSTLPVADRWFETKRFDDAITLLTEPHVHDIWRSNIWHVRGRQADLLVDAGMGIGVLRDALAPLIDKPLIALATHRHSDHVGGLHEFQTRLGHAQDADAIAKADGFASIVVSDFPAGFTSFVKEMYGTEIGELLIDAAPHDRYDPASYHVEPAPLTRIVGAGDAVDLGNRAFEVLHLPGHTPGSIGLFERRTGILFSGDAIYDGPLFDFLPESSIPDYIDTMRHLRDLPVSAAHGGHEPSFGRARMIEIIDAYVSSRTDRPTAQ